MFAKYFLMFSEIEGKYVQRRNLNKLEFLNGELKF